MKGAPSLNPALKLEADSILYKEGLYNILQHFGKPHVTGSYFLDLMTWRDLDIYLETNDITEESFFELGKKIAAVIHPVKMNFRNETITQTPGLPNGLYWGVYAGNERKGAWKIDIWAVNSNECKRLLDYCDVIKKKLSPETSRYIMQIKSMCWQDPNYRRSYNSMDIYTAVLEEKITTLEAFRRYLFQKKNL
jgi:hypothetical protein